MYEFKIQPSELDSLPFFRFMLLVSYIKEMDKQAQEQSNSYKHDDYGYSKQLKQFQKNFKQPKLPDFKNKF